MFCVCCHIGFTKIIVVIFKWLFPDMSDVGEKLLLGNDVGEEILVLKIPISPQPIRNSKFLWKLYNEWSKSQPVTFFIRQGKILPPTYNHCVQADTIIPIQYQDESRRMKDNNHNDGLRWRGRWARWCRLRPHVEAAQHWGDRHHQFLAFIC